MEKKNKEEEYNSGSQLDKRSMLEATHRLTQRLYASYSESQILIPNELIGNVRNTLEDIDRREEIKRHNKERNAKLSYSMSRSALQEQAASFAHYASMVNAPGNISSIEIPGNMTANASLPPLQHPVLNFAATTRAKEKQHAPIKERPMRIQPLTPAEVRAEASKEILGTSRVSALGRQDKTMSKLKPLNRTKEKSIIKKKQEKNATHTELIRLIQDGKSEDLNSYYYCQKGKDFYEFIQKSFDEITKMKAEDFITISARGVMHFIKKEAEFMSLAEWMDEVENYNKINQINFFKNFRKGKSFTLWKRYVKRTKMDERRAFLKKALFQGDTQINKQLIIIRNCLNALQNRDLFQLTQEQPQSLDKLSTSIKEKQDALRSELQIHEKKIIKLIMDSCDGKIQEFNQTSRNFGKEEAKKGEGKEDLPYHVFADETYHPMHYTVEARTKTLYKRLARCIRMIDYMLTQLKLNIIKNSYVELLNRLKQQSSVMKRIMPIFKVNARFENDELRFSPTVAEVKQMLTQRFADGIKMIYDRPLLADEEEFKIYMSTLESSDDNQEGKFNPLKSIADTSEFLQKKGEIDDVLDVAFSQLGKYEIELQPFIKIYRDHCQRDFSKLEGQTEGVYSRWVEEFEADKTNITDNLLEDKILGIISVDAYDMKQSILKKPKDSREMMEKIIPDHSDIIISNLKTKMGIIENGIVPTAGEDVDEYVKNKKFLEEHRRASDEYEEEILKAKALHGILSANQMRISQKRKKELDTLDSKWKYVKDKLKQTYEKYEAAEGQQKAKLQKKVPEIRDKMQAMLDELNNEKYYSKTDNPTIIVEDLLSKKETINHYEIICNKIEENETYLQLPKEDFHDPGGISEKLGEKHLHLFKFWKDQQIWHDKKAGWEQKQIHEVNIEEMNKMICEMKDNAAAAAEKIKQMSEKEFTIAEDFKRENIEPILTAINVIKNIKEDTVQTRHWQRIQKNIGCKMERKDPNLVLSVFVNILQQAQKDWNKEVMGYGKVEEWIQSIADQAKQENSLNLDFVKIRTEWERLHANTKQVGISKILQLEDPEKTFESLNECIINLQKILGSKYAAPLRDTAEKLYKNISYVEEIFDEMVIAEKKLKIIEELNSKDEFKGINLGNRLEEAIKNWKKFTGKPQGEQTRNTLNEKFVKAEGKEKADYLALCQALNKSLDEINRDFSSKIEDKQADCPRLFFMSNKEYIRILIDSQAESKKLDVITYAMQKCFASVKSILTVVENEEAYPIGVISAESEEFKASNKAKFKISDGIDKVIPAMEDLFKREIKARVKAFVTEYSGERKTRVELISTSPCQVSMVSECDIFTSNTEIVIEEDEGYEENMQTYLEEQCLACSEAGKLLNSSYSTGSSLSSTDINSPSDKLSLLNDAKRLSISALIIQYVHFRDIIDYLIRNDVHGINNFYWQAQLKFYRQTDGTIIVKQMDSCIEYGCEYLGVRNQFPITPNVERCWLSYTSALRNRFWSTVVGPPNQGKQNTIQDLASALGKFYFLYVCNKDTTARTLEKILIGTVCSFCWGVFEKANELHYSVLSAFACTLQNIRQVLIEEKAGEWHTPGPNVRSVLVIPKSQANGTNTPYSGIFLLVDHTSETKIAVPHTLKCMFRPISIVTIDLGPAAESWLYSFGFKEARSLGYRLGTFLKSVEDTIQIEGINSDFGLRTLFNIVKCSAAIKHELPDSRNENQAIYKGILTIMKSRFTDAVIPEIEKLAKTIFEINDIKKQPFIPSITQAVLDEANKKINSQYDLDIIPKLSELYNAFMNKSAIILVGEAGCGKSGFLDLFYECVRCMAADEQDKCEVIKIYPKAYTQAELYGRFMEKDWSEGILTQKLQTLVSKKALKCFNVLHCDGPIDPQWVEPLHVAFDDQKKLSLSNGDFIVLKDLYKVVFEVEDLAQAPPSLISRSAVVYFPKDLLVPRNIISKWFATLGTKLKTFEIVKEEILKHIDSLLYNGLIERSKIPKLKEEKIQLTDNAITLSFCELFEATYVKLETGLPDKTDKGKENLKKLASRVVVFALVWALGGSLSSLKLKKIEDFIDAEVIVGEKPKDMNCFDAFIKINDEFGEWLPWTDKHEYRHSTSLAFTQIAVPTKQLLRYSWFVETMAVKSKNILLFGESGSGKSLIAANALLEGRVEETKPAALNEESNIARILPEEIETSTKLNEFKLKQYNLCFTWHTTPTRLQRAIEERLDKKRKNLYSAPIRKRAVFFIDDVNIPETDSYGTVPSLEYLRCILAEHGYFDKNRFFWKKIKKTTFLCAGSPADGGRKEMSLRLLRHFNVFYMNTISFSEYHSLFESVVFAHFANLGKEYTSLKSGYLDALIDIHEKLMVNLPGNPRHPHYMLSHKERGKVLSGFLLSRSDNINSQEQLSRLFIHECFRVYQDRYTNPEDRAIFIAEANKIIEGKLNSKWKIEDQHSIYFTSLTTPTRDNYIEISDWKEIQKMLEVEQEQSNKDAEAQNIPHNNLVFFKEAVEYIMKIARILLIPRSHMINIGPPALGRRSLIYIASFFMNFDFKEMDYNMRDFDKKYKKTYESVADALEKVSPEEAAGVVLMAKVGQSNINKNDDKKLKIERNYELTTDTILDDLTQILSTGDLLTLGIPLKKADLRNNLRIVLSIPNNMSDVRLKMKMYPLLFSECNLVYQDFWPMEATVSIVQAQLMKASVEKIKAQVSDVIVLMQKAVEAEAQKAKFDENRKILIAPSQVKEMSKKFLELYEHNDEILGKAKADLDKAINHIENSQKLVEEYLSENTKSKGEADQRKNEVDTTHSALNQLERDIENRKKEIMEDEEKDKKEGGAKTNRKVPSDKMTQQLKDALSELANLKPKFKGFDWKQISSIIEPTASIEAVLSAVYILTGDSHAQWENMVKTMNKKKTDAITNIDLNTISDFSFFEVKLLREDARSSNADKFPPTVEILYEWLSAVIDVFNETKKALNNTSELEQKKEALYALMEQQNKKKKEYLVLFTEKEKLGKIRSSLEYKVFNLKDLYQNIALQNGDWRGIEEWKTKRDRIMDKQSTLLGDVLFTAGVISFFGGFSLTSRDRLKSEWKKIYAEHSIKISDQLKIETLIASSQIINEWHSKGLLKDETCIENALIINYSNRWPLIIDPEGAAMRWLGGKKRIKATNPHAYDEIKKEISQGTEIILDEIPEMLDENIVELLEIPRQRVQSGEIGLRDGKIITVQKGFNIFLRITHRNPVFSDDLCNWANIVNFTLSQKALQDIFAVEYALSSGDNVVADIFMDKEDPLIKDKGDKENLLITQMNQLDLSKIDEDDQRMMKDKLLETLKVWLDLEKRIVDNKSQTSKENEKKMNEILPLVSLAGTIQRCVSTLTIVNPIYLFTFEAIKDIFNSTIKANPGNNAKWGSFLIQNVLIYLERRMFLTDFRMFAFYLAASISLETKDINSNEWLIILYGAEYWRARDFINPVKNSNPKLISEKNWNLLGYLEKAADVYQGISQDMVARGKEWEQWITNKTPQQANFPGVYQKKLTKSFQRFLLIRILCPERIVECRDWCTTTIITDFYLKIKHPAIADVFAETRVNRPLLVLKEEGDDPTPLMTKFGGVDVEPLTLTQDYEQTIKPAMDSSKKTNDKPEVKNIFVRDIHTIPEFIRYVCEKIKEFSQPSNDLNDKLRYIFTCNACRLPGFLLLNTIRLTHNPSKLMKQKITNNVLAFQQQEALALSIPANKDKYSLQYKRLTLSLSILHAVLDKRNIFGRKAWSRPFKITKGEIEATSKLLLYTLDSYKDQIQSPTGSPTMTQPQVLPWDALRKVIEEIYLGGKIVEEYDHKILNCFIDMYINEEASNGNYAFKEHSVYKIPTQATYPDILKYVESLPEADDFEICNVSPEATIIVQRGEAEKMLVEIQQLDSRKNQKQAESLQIVKETAKFEAIVKKITEEMPEHGLVKEDINPAVTELKKGVLYGHHMFLLQEMSRYNSLIQKIQTTMEKINDYLNKGNLMPTYLEKIYFALAESRVPEEFTGYTWNHPLGEWIITLKKRIEYIRDWLKAGEIKGYWLRALIHPQGLFNSLLLYYSQKYEQTVEKLTLSFDFTSYRDVSEITESDPQTSYIYDMYMINGKFNIDTNMLAEFTPEDQSKFTCPIHYSRLPLISITPTNDIKEESTGFECPVYYLPTKQNKVGSLQNLLTKIDCPTNLKNQYWYLKGLFITCIDPELNT